MLGRMVFGIYAKKKKIFLGGSKIYFGYLN
jgi:hypothetical protein